jgi:hypothetical protein
MAGGYSDFEFILDNKLTNTQINEVTKYQGGIMAIQRAAQHSIETSNLADILERVLDKGVVIAGDIRIKLVDIELLTIQLRLVICSVDKAKEMGMDWWVNNPAFSGQVRQEQSTDSLHNINERLERLERSAAK